MDHQALMNWLPSIITGILLILGFIGLHSKITKITEEIGHLFTAISIAMSDKQLTQEEIADIKLKIEDLVAAFKEKKK